jgi:hypothetical protein
MQIYFLCSAFKDWECDMEDEKGHFLHSTSVYEKIAKKYLKITL